MTFRHILLAVAAALVLGLGVYLFFEVRAKPATAEARPRPGATAAADQEREPGGTTAAARTERDPTTAVGSGTGSSPLAGRIRPRKPSGGKLTDVPASDPEVVPELESGDRPQKLDIAMAEANKHYDRGDFDEARAIAKKVLQKSPGNARMLRVLVSAACIEGDGPEAQKHYNELAPTDREQMKTRCAKYDVTFTEPKAP